MNMSESFEHIKKRLDGFRFRSMKEAAERCCYTESTMWRVLETLIASGEAAAMIREEGWTVTFDPMELSTEALARETGLTRRTMQLMADELIAKGYSRRIGKVLISRRSAIDYIRSRPENRGRPVTPLVTGHFKK